MTTPRVVLLSLWLGSCAWATSDGATVERWSQAMERLDETCEAWNTSLLEQPRGELAEVARQAEDAAARMRLGYGVHEDRTVPGFAKMARDAESWLLQIALEARAGHGELAANLYRTGRVKHCNECHDAEERAHQ